MDMEKFSDSVKVDGEIYDFDPEAATALVPCENCGHLNEADVTKDGDDAELSAFSCENCGHWNSFD